MSAERPVDDRPEEIYLELLKLCLTRYGFVEHRAAHLDTGLSRFLDAPLQKLLARKGLRLVRSWRAEGPQRAEGRDWPEDAETMIGLRRLDNLHRCVADVLDRGVPGDLLEAGVWRGGASIFMRGALKAYGAHDRVVWVADSFQGLPKPDVSSYPLDAGDRNWEISELAIPLEEVEGNFRRYRLLDAQVRFLPGWFADTLPAAPIERLAILRLDGDMYGSTMETLSSMYPKLSPGGYVIIDDFALPTCAAAVRDFRERHGITDPIETIDWTGAYWQRSGAGPSPDAEGGNRTHTPRGEPDFESGASASSATSA